MMAGLKDVFVRTGAEALKGILDAEVLFPSEAGKKKRAYVVMRLDDMVMLPWYLEPFDGPFFALVVDALCSALNDRFGHRWNRLTNEEGKE